MVIKTNKLLKVLDDMIIILENDNEIFWLSQLQKSKSRLKNSDFSGIELLLGFYGGMGSFSDLVIGQPNGNDEFNSNFQKINNNLNTLRSQAWELANTIKRGYESK